MSDHQALLEEAWELYRADHYEAAYDILERVAKAGDADIAFFLGQEFGVYAKRKKFENFPKAAKWFKFSADHGYAAGAYEYGLALVQGIGIRADLNLGLQYIESAARDGNELALEFMLNPAHQQSYGFALVESQSESFAAALAAAKASDA